ncbi:MAG: FAD-dependent oxidoreductase [Aquabacterium sp.]|nr:FAD-dependent oxidoreductase [Aquabacterium sp.]
MIDVAIVGAGLTGLALARQLHLQGLRVALFDARMRTGGRILTDVPATGGAAVDLGASWYWPDTEPRVTALIESLGLRSLAQPDHGMVLNLADASRAPEALDAQGIHGGARRLAGGMGKLVNTLVNHLPEDTVQLGRRLVSVQDRGEHLALRFELVASDTSGGAPMEARVMARRVVLAMPPRLVAQHIRFEPVLPAASVEAMNAVSTWMAREAKSFARYTRPFWLQQGWSGSAFVSHAHAVLREVWDASDEEGAALAGFHAMTADTRPRFARSMPLLVSSQFAQLFGLDAQVDAITTQDWATDPLTCSALDLTDSLSGPPQAAPVLRRPHWSGRLFFGGTETARQAAGHMEGALESAARLADFLRPMSSSHQADASRADAALARFQQWVTAERAQAMPRYQQQVKQMLSRQDRDRVTQRAVLAAVEQTYSRALEQLACLTFGMDAPSGAGVHADEGRHALTQPVLATFAGFSKTLVADALVFNAQSCALSNFPDEHQPPPDYLRAITADLAAAWLEFAWATNDLLSSRALQAH